MRPKTIVYFEWLRFGAIAIGVFQTMIAWNANASGSIFTLASHGLTYAFVIALTLLVSRLRSVVAMWISIGLFVLGLPSFFTTYVEGHLHGSGLIALVHVIANLVAYPLLFTPSARAWMSKKPLTANPNKLGLPAN